MAAALFQIGDGGLADAEPLRQFNLRDRQLFPQHRQPQLENFLIRFLPGGGNDGGIEFIDQLG